MELMKQLEVWFLVGSQHLYGATTLKQVADHAHTWAKCFRFSGDRARIKEWSTQMALDLLRRRLANLLPAQGDAGGSGP